MNPLVNQFKKYGTISSNVENEIVNRTKIYRKRKGDYFLKEGQVNSSIFVIENGLVRVFKKTDSREINTWFAAESEIIGSILPMYSNRPSFEYIQFLEDSVIYSITISDLNELYKSFPEFNLIGRKIAENLCEVLEERIISLHTNNAEERYQQLIQKFPYLLQRVNLGHIASYLGITQETLSRIRSRF